MLEMYSPVQQGPGKAFTIKNMNIMDPLLPTNNLGRSVNKASKARIRKALAHGCHMLDSIFDKVRMRPHVPLVPHLAHVRLSERRGKIATGHAVLWSISAFLAEFSKAPDVSRWGRKRQRRWTASFATPGMRSARSCPRWAACTRTPFWRMCPHSAARSWCLRQCRPCPASRAPPNPTPSTPPTSWPTRPPLQPPTCMTATATEV